MKGLLFTYALTYGGAVVSLFNPFYGLLIYVCFAIMRPETYVAVVSTQWRELQPNRRDLRS